MPHTQARRVRVRVMRVPTHVNGIGHHPTSLHDWTSLTFMDGLIVPELPRYVLIDAPSALRAMRSNYRMWTYWDAFDRGRSWDNEDFDGYFAVPKQCCRVIKTISERRARILANA